MRSWSVLLRFLLLVAVLPVRGDGPGDRLLAAGVAEFSAAYRTWEAGRFAAAAALFRQAATEAPDSAAAYYWLGTAHFHELLQLRSVPETATNTVRAAAAMDAALEALDTALERDPRNAETHALLGTLYGMKIDGNLFRGARLGPKVAKHRKQALALGPDNPRVRYLLGTCQFHTARKPAAWRDTIETLLLAGKLFTAEAAQPAGPLDPRWGHSSCLTFTGRAHERLGQREEAAQCFRQALALHPADHLAREGLTRVTQPVPAPSK